MADVTVAQQFHGTVALMVLHLRRLAHSNDVDAGFAAARELRMIDPEQERFMRSCYQLDARGDSCGDAVQLERLRACILSINSADPA